METGNLTPRWWSKSNSHEHIFQLVKYLEQHQSWRKAKNLTHARLYSNSEMLGLDAGDYMGVQGRSIYSDRDDRIRLNVVAAVIDTVSSKIAKNKPRVVMLPSGGDFDLQQRAKRLEKFVAGAFYGADLYEESIKVFLDASIFGTGVMKIFAEDGNIVAERVLPNEIVIDDEEGFRGKPRQLHQRRDVSREVLMDMFPGKSKELKEATKLRLRHSVNTSKDIADHVTVVESWHLPSGPNAKDGKHIISVSSGILFQEEYTKKDFPFVFLRWKRPVVGFWGIGIAEDLVGIQVEINKILMKVQKAFHLLSNPMVFLHQSSAISKAHINNQIGIIVPYTGQPPIIRAAQTVHPEVFQHLERLYMRAFEIVGVSQLAATSRKPEGLDSGAALREFNDIESERFALAALTYEHMFIDIARKMIDIARDLYAENENLEIMAHGRDFIETIKWSEVSLEDDQFSLIASAASSLPHTRAGRVQRATEWLQIGAISIQEWRELVEIPDLEDDSELKRAPRDYVREVVSRILNKGEMIEPESLDNLNFALEYAMMQYQKAKLNNVPIERVELLRQYIDSVQFLLDQAEELAMQDEISRMQDMAQLQAAGNAQVATAPQVPKVQPMEAQTPAMQV